MYLTTVNEASCRLLIMLGGGLRCKVLSDKCFSQCTDPVILVILLVLQEILQTPFSNKKKKKKRKPTGSWHTRNIRVTLIGSSRIFKHMVLVLS